MNAIMQNFDKIFNASLIYATFRSATPIIFAALCAAITQQANILNIGTEGIMLVGAFTAVAVSYFTGSWLLGIIAAMIAGAVIAMIMAVGHIRYNSEICAIGMGINLLALALTKLHGKCDLPQHRQFFQPGHQSNSACVARIFRQSAGGWRPV